MLEPARHDRWRVVGSRIPGTISLTPGRLARLLALAVAVVSIIAAAAGPASAATLSGTTAASPGPEAATEAAPIASPENWTFSYTGGPQVFTVPAGVTFLTATVTGGRGGYPNDGAGPGPGGQTVVPLNVSAGQQLTVWVGANAGGSGGWGYTCGGDQGIATPDPPGAFDGGGGGGSSAVTSGSWSSGAGNCDGSTRPSGNPI